MAKADAERDLLFGMLAVQIGLIDQVALVAALHEWTRAQDRAMADVLVEQRALDAEGKALIEALALKQLKRHGDDPEKSLAALQAGRSTAEGLAQIGDPDLEATEAHVGSDPTVDIDRDGTGSHAVGTATSEGQRFRVLRPHARGGLGAVFVALDAELNREVALKQILDRHADDPTSRTRFLIEAEITGGLEHPGIVPVYGLGSYGNGRPYYAMRFIRGDSLKEAIERFHGKSAEPAETGSATQAGDGSGSVRSVDSEGSRDLDLRKLLRRFLDVCNAIDYAHSRGVLHRDIKPANIIIGKHGETLVVDWGLAKATGKGDTSAGEQMLMPISASGSAQTTPGSAMGTPAFMSPEQARGEIDRLGPRSDVYSLGATLYSLLTGKSPVELEGDDIHAVLRAVQKDEFSPPRQLDPTIDKTLEAVCLKAMALQPEDRYTSSRALADDIERWMADEPVTAMPDSWARQLARWSRRHRSATRAAATSLMVIATVATMAALAIGREHARTRSALRAETQARRDESQARGLAQEQSQLALEAIREYNTGVTREFLLQQPEMEGLRKSLLQAPIRFYRILAQNIEHNGLSDPGARARLGQAQFDLGEIISEVGTTEDSIITLEQARDNIEQALDGDPSSPEYRFLLARTRCFLGNRYDKASRPAEARKSFDLGLSDYERLVRAYPGDRRYRADQAEALQHRADFLWDHGDLDGSRRDYIASIAIGAALVVEYPDDLDILDKHAASLNNLSILFSEAGQRDRRERTLSEATALRERLVAATSIEDPRRETFSSNLASCYQNLGTAHLDNGDLEEARAWFRKALAIQEEQVKRRPNLVTFLERVGASHSALGQLETRTGHLETARTELSQARGFLERLVGIRPGDVIFRMHLVSALGFLADVEIESGSTAAALNLERRAVSEAEEVLRINPRYHPGSQGLAFHLRRDANLSWEIGESARALANLARAEAILRELVASYGELTEYRSDLATTIRAHVRMDREIGRDHGAEPRLREAIAITESALRDDPDLVLNLETTSAVCSDLGAMLGHRGRPAEAQPLFSRAFDLLEQARTRSPRDARIRCILVQTLAAHAEFLGRLGQVRESLADWDRALAQAVGDELLEVRLGRAATRARSGDYRAALADVATAERATPDRANLLIRFAAFHAGVSEAINRDPALSEAARATGFAAPCDAALGLVRRAAATPAYRDARRLLSTLSASEFDPLRTHPGFQLLMRDLAFPPKPFARPD
jgi:eukaryotic-like serine/threonine-protein kinase